MFNVVAVCAREYVEAKAIALDEQLQKIKDVYNAFAKKYCPLSFEDDEQTLLASNIKGKNIILSQPYTDFDFLYIIYASEVTSSSCILSKYEINRRLRRGKTNWNLINGFASLYWTIGVAKTTPTFFPYASSGVAAGNASITILKIIGIKIKEVT